MPSKTSKQTVDSHSKNFLTEHEIKRFLAAARKSRHSVRDFCLMLLAYRHGMRVSELVDVRLKDVDLETARIFVRRVKGSLSTHQPIEGDELRAIRAWLRERESYPSSDSNYLFLSERGGSLTRQAVNYIAEETGKRAKLNFKVTPHMLRHSTGYFLANRGYDTRLVQDYLGHKNIMHTVRTRERRQAGLKTSGDKALGLLFSHRGEGAGVLYYIYRVGARPKLRYTVLIHSRLSKIQTAF